MGRIRSLLFSDADEALDKIALPYLRLFDRHPVLMRLASAAVLVFAAIVWYREGWDDFVMLMVIAAIVVVIFFLGLWLPYVAIRAAVRRARRGRST